MKFSMKSLAAGVALALGSTMAFAQVVPVTPPTSFTAAQIGGGSNNGGLMVAVWDSVRSVSVVEYLGLNMDGFLPAANSTPGTGYDFGTLGQFSSTFGASSAANIQYAVFALDSSGSGNSGKRVLSTTNNSTAALTNSQVSATATILDGFLNVLNAGSGNPATDCNGVNPCVATAASESDYVGGISWGSLAINSNIATIGTAMNFYLSASVSNAPQTAATTTLFGPATGRGQWLLGTDGHLSYSVPAVPIPAAVWLLLSGLGGLGAISRRRVALAA